MANDFFGLNTKKFENKNKIFSKDFDIKERANALDGKISLLNSQSPKDRQWANDVIELHSRLMKEASELVSVAKNVSILTSLNKEAKNLLIELDKKEKEEAKKMALAKKQQEINKKAQDFDKRISLLNEQKIRDERWADHVFELYSLLLSEDSEVIEASKNVGNLKVLNDEAKQLVKTLKEKKEKEEQIRLENARQAELKKKQDALKARATAFDGKISLLEKQKNRDREWANRVFELYTKLYKEESDLVEFSKNVSILNSLNDEAKHLVKAIEQKEKEDERKRIEDAKKEQIRLEKEKEEKEAAKKAKEKKDFLDFCNEFSEKIDLLYRGKVQTLSWCEKVDSLYEEYKSLNKKYQLGIQNSSTLEKMYLSLDEVKENIKKDKTNRNANTLDEEIKDVYDMDICQTKIHAIEDLITKFKKTEQSVKNKCKNIKLYEYMSKNLPAIKMGVDLDDQIDALNMAKKKDLAWAHKIDDLKKKIEQANEDFIPSIETFHEMLDKANPMLEEERHSIREKAALEAARKEKERKEKEKENNKRKKKENRKKKAEKHLSAGAKVFNFIAPNLGIVFTALTIGMVFVSRLAMLISLALLILGVIICLSINIRFSINYKKGRKSDDWYDYYGEEKRRSVPLKVRLGISLVGLVAMVITFFSTWTFSDFSANDGLLKKYNDYNATSFVVPQEIKEIGPNAFKGKSKLKEVILHENMILDENAFKNSSIESLTLPSGVTLRSGALANSKITSLEILNGAIVEEKAFIDLKTQTPSLLEEIKVENGVQLNDWALSGVKAPLSGSYFENLTSWSGAFKGYMGETLTIPSHVTSLSDYAFEGITSTLIFENENLIQPDFQKIYAKYLGTEIHVPENTTTFSASAFEDCKNLVSINIPETLTRVEEKAFYGCTSLPRIILPSTVEYIGVSAFEYCSSLQDLSVPFIGSSISDTNTFGYFFGTAKHGSKFKDVTQQSKKYYIPKSLKNVVISGNVQLAPQAFHGCGMIKNFFVPNITRIGEFAFGKLDKKCSVYVGISLEYICRDAFTSSSLVDLYYEGSKEAFDSIEKEKNWNSAMLIPSYINSFYYNQNVKQEIKNNHLDQQ